MPKIYDKIIYMKRVKDWFIRFAFRVKQNPIVRLFFFLTILILISSGSVLFFEYKANPEQFGNYFDSIWWTIVTITTVGYGDKVPASIAGKVLALGIMFCGMILVGMISGRIASFFVERNLREGRGLGKYSELRKHFIICGWKRGMEKIIKDILLYNPELDPADIVIICSVKQQFIDEFRQISGNEKIKIIRGDSSSEEVLRRASLRQAQKVMVLASDMDSEKPSETDSKTIMTVMTLKNITKEVYVIAELIDKNYERYLTLAGCDEILLSSEYARILLANTSSSSGMSHIVYDILDAQTPAAIATQDIPEEFLNQPFSALTGYFAEHKKILIGILENTGNAFKMKKEALREAQKNPDISMIVRNLKESKHLEINKPLINPSKDYVIKKHDMAIIIKSREVA